MVDGKENDGWILILNGKYCVTRVFLPWEIYPLHVIWHAYGNQNINTWHSASFWMISMLFLTVLWMSWLSGLVGFFWYQLPVQQKCYSKNDVPKLPQVHHVYRFFMFFHPNHGMFTTYQLLDQPQPPVPDTRQVCCRVSAWTVRFNSSSRERSACR